MKCQDKSEENAVASGQTPSVQNAVCQLQLLVHLASLSVALLAGIILT